MRLLLTESLVLSVTGAGLGFFVARGSSRLLVQELSTQTNTVFLDLSVRRPDRLFIAARIKGQTEALTGRTRVAERFLPGSKATVAPSLRSWNHTARTSLRPNV